MFNSILGFIKDFFWFILFLSVVLLVLWIDSNTNVEYYIYRSDIDNTFVEQVRNIMANTDWGKYKVIEVDKPENAIITIRLCSRKEMDKWHDEPEYYPSGKEIRFSITTQNQYIKPKIFIDSGNWLNGVPESGLELKDYRNYVIRHEFMHALSYDHQPCNEETAVNGVCPVLYQSTRGCPKGYKCGSNILPVDFTKRLTHRYL